MKKFKVGFIQIALITKQQFGTIPTICLRCGKQETFKIIREDGSYSKLCNCGCTLIQFHKKDEYHKNVFFTKKFIPAKLYNPKHKNMTPIEKKLTKIGYRKKEIKHKKVLEK